MNFKEFSIAALVLMTSMNITKAIAESKGGGGGTVLDCGGSVKLADFEEIKYRRGLQGKLIIPESTANVEEQVNRAIGVISQGNTKIAEKLSKELKVLNSSMEEVGADYEWALTPDVGFFPVPLGCALKNAVMYLDSGDIEINMRLYNKLSPTHKAGLKIHEIVYKVMRDSQKQESTLPTRRLTALAFSQTPDAELLESLVLKYLLPNKGEHFVFLTPEQVPYFRFTSTGFQDSHMFLGEGMGEIAKGNFENSFQRNTVLPVGKIVDLYVYEMCENCYRQPDNAFAVLYLVKSSYPQDKWTSPLREDERPENATAHWNIPFKIGRAEYLLIRLAIVSPKLQSYLDGKL